MITCCIRYEIDPFNVESFERYARNWGQAIPRCGADLIGYFAPHDGTRPLLRLRPGRLRSLSRLAAGRPDRPRKHAFARQERFIRREDRIFLRLVSGPHAALVRP